MKLRTLYPNIWGDEIDIGGMIRDLRVEGMTKEQIEDYIISWLLDEGVLIPLTELKEVILDRSGR